MGQTVMPRAAVICSANGKLRQQVRLHPVAGLVPVEQVVAKGPDHAVKRRRDVRNVGLAQQRNQTLRQPVRRLHIPPIGSDAPRPRRVVRAEQLKSAVNQVNLHRRPNVSRSRRFMQREDPSPHLEHKPRHTPAPH